jgi:hypothetical protein
MASALAGKKILLNSEKLFAQYFQDLFASHYFKAKGTFMQHQELFHGR